MYDTTFTWIPYFVNLTAGTFTRCFGAGKVRSFKIIHYHKKMLIFLEY